MSTVNICFIGATGKSVCRFFADFHLTHPGFIGGSILSSLISHRLAKLFSITVLIRSSSKVELFRSLGIRAVVGSNSDLQLLTADSDDVTAIDALLAGMKLHFERTGKAASLIHTSGTGVLSDDTKGMRATETIYSDLNTALLDTIAPTQPHRSVDLTMFEADEQGYVKTYIVAPGSIYGRAKGPLAAMRVHSIHIPALVEIALSRKQAGVFGEARMSGSILAYPTDLGIGGAEPTKFTEEENKQHPILDQTSVGANSRATSDRVIALGWKPKDTTESMLMTIEEVKSAIHK
ncbi:hypothetical protein CPB85DRAFT_1372989 [Mucidula mucida]|nr:hypothetical protein CPB85DRAFT_1372989 [Mucidula mucida]